MRNTRIAIPALVQLLGSQNANVQDRTLTAIANLCVDDRMEPDSSWSVLHYINSAFE